MENVYIVAAKRSPIGKFGGSLSGLSPRMLGAAVARAITNDHISTEIGEVILGQVLQAGAGMNVARQIGLELGLSEVIPAWTVNMVCGSSLQAVALAADAIRLGRCGLVLAGGVEVMSRAPHYHRDLRNGKKLGPSSLDDAILADGLTDPVLGIHMGETAERIADQFGITREEQDNFAAESQQKVELRRADLAQEMIPVADLEADEHPRSGTTVETLSTLRPAFRRDGTVTAGNASSLNDGAAMILLAGEATVARLGLEPLARLVATAVVGCAPDKMGLGPVGAIRAVTATVGWTLSDVDTFEINEAFAAQVLGCQRELKIPPDRLNPRGGAIALGHPIGASGARVLVTLLHEMQQNQLKRGVASLCVGGGMGIAVAMDQSNL